MIHQIKIRNLTLRINQTERTISELKSCKRCLYPLMTHHNIEARTLIYSIDDKLKQGERLLIKLLDEKTFLVREQQRLQK